ncbi:hypothetical protein J6590_030993 [Homalodisca vitripennis]|nr:hypothetical protein J6590_030993 [Homalodisca vitripennis]
MTSPSATRGGLTNILSLLPFSRYERETASNSLPVISLNLNSVIDISFDITYLNAFDLPCHCLNSAMKNTLEKNRCTEQHIREGEKQRNLSISYSNVVCHENTKKNRIVKNAIVGVDLERQANRSLVMARSGLGHSCTSLTVIIPSV